MSRRSRNLFLVLIALFAAVAGIYAWYKKQHPELEDDTIDIFEDDLVDVE